MDILKAIGMFFIVMGHIHQPTYFYFGAYMFHVPLFFFISGYFFKPLYGAKKIVSLVQKAKKLLIPYFSFGLFFAFITFCLISFFNIQLGEMPNFYNFFIDPFLYKTPYPLYVAGWFIPQLFVIYVVFQLLYFFKRNKKVYSIILMLGLFIGSLFVVYTSIQGLGDVNLLGSQIKIFLLRTIFLAFFYGVGYITKLGLPRFEKYLVNKITLIIFTLLSVSVVLNYGRYAGFYTHELQFNTDNVLLPHFTSLVGIYFWFIVASYISKFVKENSFIMKIGQNSFYIMALHLFIFFIINIFFVQLYQLPMDNLSNIWFSYKKETFWLLYVGLGISIPTLFGLTIKKFFSKSAPQTTQTEALHIPSPSQHI